MHVVQQTRPGAARALRRISLPGQAAYWQGKYVGKSKRKAGDENHSIVLPAMGKENSIFTEAPVPNADKSGAGFGKKGWADFYDGKDKSQTQRTVGIFFTAHHKPEALASDKDSLKDGAKFSHLTISRPKLDPTGGVIGVDEAPRAIGVADLKPSHGTVEALEGTEQLSAYQAGF